MPKPLLILYSANSCSACTNFLKNSWDNVKKSVAGYVDETIHISQSTMSPSDWNADMPQSLKSMISYFPSILIVRASDWNAAKSDKNAIVSALLYPARDRSDLVEWVKL